MVAGFSIAKWVILGLGGAFTILFLRDAAQKGLGPAASDLGAGISSITYGLGGGAQSIGLGIQALGTGVGTGVAQLFNPLFTLRDLIYGPQAGNQPAPTAATNGQLPASEPPLAAPPAIAEQPPLFASNAFTPITVQRPSGGTLSVNQVFNPLGSGRDVLSIRGTPLAANALSRRQVTYSGVLTTSRGSRNIRGSQRLFQRLNS